MRGKGSGIWNWSDDQPNRVARFQNRLRGRQVTTLHHLACSGGTLFAKCLATMEGAFALSDIHPDRTAQPAFHPLYQAKLGYGDLLGPNLLSRIDMHFLLEIWLVDDFAQSLDRHLILRDHSHVDFVIRQQPRSMLVDVISRSFRVTPIITIRNPIEVYVSLKKNDWFDGSPDDLCKAHLALLDAFPQAPVFRYEDLVKSPEATMRELCQAVGIPYQPDFQARTEDIRQLTGDSGRGGDAIAPRTAKNGPIDVINAFAKSSPFARICDRFGYETTISPILESMDDFA